MNEWRRRLPTVIEIALALVVAVAAGRLSVRAPSVDEPGAVDVGFSQDMAVHHEQAVLMANLAQTHGTTAVTGLADAILINQSQEIGLMRGWLQLWHQPTTDPRPMSWMSSPSHGMSGMSSTAMPGMATPDQLTRLASLSGKRFDALFLELMIRHHEGGLQMCQFAEAHASLAVVRRAAVSMAVEQVEDLGQLRALLKAAG
ncbi:MAG TPA: DUF305 domain-containing protein [Mycobacteriales bacterium]|nr:DUF305 domain-containing protein [Mycobacteriales bacterium]